MRNPTVTSDLVGSATPSRSSETTNSVAEKIATSFHLRRINADSAKRSVAKKIRRLPKEEKPHSLRQNTTMAQQPSSQAWQRPKDISSASLPASRERSKELVRLIGRCRRQIPWQECRPCKNFQKAAPRGLPSPLALLSGIMPHRVFPLWRSPRQGQSDLSRSIVEYEISDGGISGVFAQTDRLLDALLDKFSQPASGQILFNW